MWQETYIDTRVLTADPLELVHILYEHTLAMVRDARRHLASGDIPGRGRSVTRAIAAIDELDSSLDRSAGGSIGQNLAALYQYMRLRLLNANIRQEDEPLAEVESLLQTLGEAWSAIRPGGEAAQAVETKVPQAFGAFGTEPQAEYAGQGWSA